MKDPSGTKALQVHDRIVGTAAGHIENKNDSESDHHERFRIIESKIREVIRKQRDPQPEGFLTRQGQESRRVIVTTPFRTYSWTTVRR